MSKPQFEHNCSSCAFLGNYTDGVETVDLYYCSDKALHLEEGSICVRVGNGPLNCDAVPIDILKTISNAYKEKYSKFLEALRRYNAAPKDPWGFIIQEEAIE